MTIKRKNHGKGHTYQEIETGLTVPGVTTILGKGIPHPAYAKAGVRSVVDYATDHWESLNEMPPSERAKALTGAQYQQRDKAGNKGTVVHKLAAKLVLGKTVTIPEGLEGYVNSYVRFLDEFNVEPELVETVVVNHEHRYCGTLDLLADLTTVDPETGEESQRKWLLDIATNASGVWGERGLQIAGYRYADAWVDEDGVEYDIPEVEATGVVWVQPDFYQLKPVDAGPDEFRTFLYAQQIGQWLETSRDLVGDAIEAPHTSTWRLERG